MKTFILFACIFILISSSYAQEEKVTLIRNSYTEYNKNLQKSIEEGAPWAFPKMVITGERMERAIGLVSRSTTFYYDYSSDFEEKSENMIEKFVLRKIIYEQKSTSGSYKLYEEYYFNEKEEFLFYYKKSTLSGCGEYRFYFDNNKPIKIKVNPINKDEWIYEPDDVKNCDFIHHSKDFSKTDLITSGLILKSAKRYIDLFLKIHGS